MDSYLEDGLMWILIAGMILGFAVGLVLLAFLAKSKESDTLTWQALEQLPSMGDEHWVITR